MISKMIPIVTRIPISATKPMTSRTNPRMITLLPPPAHLHASCAEDLADRTLIVPTPNCQSARLHEANGGGEPRRSGGSVYGEPSKNGSEHAIENVVCRVRGKVGSRMGNGRSMQRATFPVPARSAEGDEERLNRQKLVVERVAIVRNAQRRDRHDRP
jgi:hypothetical protein